MMGIQQMSKMWQSNRRLVKTVKKSIEFVCRGPLGPQNHVFRIERIPKESLPKLVAYAGDPPQDTTQRKTRKSADIRYCARRKGEILPVNPDKTRDWRKDLKEDTPRELREFHRL